MRLSTTDLIVSEIRALLKEGVGGDLGNMLLEVEINKTGAEQWYCELAIVYPTNTNPPLALLRGSDPRETVEGAISEVRYDLVRWLAEHCGIKKVTDIRFAHIDKMYKPLEGL